MKVFVEEGQMTGLREMAEIAGRLSATGAAITPARRMLRELFKFITPSAWEKRWEATLPKTEGMGISLELWMHTEDGGFGNLRTWNAVGSPICPDFRLEHLRPTTDTGTLVGCSMNGAVRVPCREVSVAHADEHPVHREVDARKLAVDREGSLRPNAGTLTLVDARVTVESATKGDNNIDTVYANVDTLWAACLRWGRTLRCEHISGDEMVVVGVDGFSRASEGWLA